MRKGDTELRPRGEHTVSLTLVWSCLCLFLLKHFLTALCLVRCIAVGLPWQPATWIRTSRAQHNQSDWPAYSSLRFFPYTTTLSLRVDLSLPRSRRGGSREAEKERKTRKLRNTAKADARILVLAPRLCFLPSEGLKSFL